MTNKKIVMLLVLFIGMMTAGRLAWLEHFRLPDAPVAEAGMLDLREWEPLATDTLPLDGEWTFYPETFLYGDQAAVGLANEAAAVSVPVPNKRSGDAETAAADAVYGSYRLQVQLDPGQNLNIGLRIPGIRSSAEVYLNGELVVKNGEIGKTAATYEPINRPRTVYYTVGKSGLLDIVVQYADFENPSEKGISQPIVFGLIGPFTRSQNFSSIIVIASCVIYLIHGIYSLILYFLFGKDRRFLAFFGIIICVMLGTLIAERLLFEWLPFTLEWRTKTIYLTMLLGGFSLFQAIRSLLPAFWRDIFSRYYSLVCAGVFGLILVLPARLVLAWAVIPTGLLLLPYLLTPFTLGYATKKISGDNFFLLLAGIASVWSLFWMILNHALAIDMMPYPFDLLLALICFSSYWFKRYFRLFMDSRELALKLQLEDKQKDEFLMTVAHEMRNPLHAILNITGSVINTEAERISAPARDDLELLQTIGRHMSTLVNSLLDLEQLNLNRLRLQMRDTSLHSTTGAVLDMIRYMTDGRTMRLVNRVPEDFPLVSADQNRLIQILFNLLHNAVKYADARELSVTAVVVAGVAEIRVQDDGVGIDAVHLDGLFERYKQVPGPLDAPDYGGIGLGLDICRRLVRLHGGELTVSSVVGEGTVFAFTLPLAAKDFVGAGEARGVGMVVAAGEAVGVSGMARDAAMNTSVAGGETDGLAAIADSVTGVALKNRSGAIRVLAVDDDPVNLKIMQTLFPAPDYALATAANGLEALALMESGSWDLIIADVMMPHMSGYELTRRIRERFTAYELPVLLLTARGQAEDIVSGFLAGANDYVVKPIEGYVLKARANTLVNLKGSISERFRIEAALLQAQIQPHFLFNTINSIVSLSESDPNKMTELLIAFGDYLQYSFDPENAEPLVPIRHELDLLEAYLFIQKQRFGDRLTVVWDVDERLACEIPPLSIQPIVENAIKHGVLKRVRGGTVQIRITEDKHAIIVAIRDDGVGMDADQLRKLQKGSARDGDGIGIGIRNTNRRLKQLFGQELSIFSRVDEGTTVMFEVPKG
nr:ATP-binding protein [uncultured Trichococcus sp.]